VPDLFRDGRVSLAIALFVTIGSVRLGAQGVEVTPFGGFRVGGGFVETNGGRPLDTGAAPAAGIAVDVPLANGLQFEAAFSRQRADLLLSGQPATAPSRWRVVIDHFQAGGLQEFMAQRPVRPFLSGVLGLTRYASGDEDPVRFVAGAGGGVKLFPSSRLGVRLDGRVFATLIDADGTGLACGSRGCLVALHVNVAWQAEFTAGLAIRVGRLARPADP
jgi:hypothetical protein